MRHTLLLLAILTHSASAAPRLKDRTPAPDPEEARISALRAKYADLRARGQPGDGPKLDLAKAKLQIFLLAFDHVDRQPANQPLRQEVERELAAELRADQILKDLYDIARYDRKKAGDAK